MSRTLHPETLAIRGFKEQTEYNEHNQALFLTSSFMWPSAADAEALFAGKQAGYTYSRTANPTTATFAKRVAMLEGAEQAVATGTGMSAIQAALLTFLSAGDHLVCSRSLFGTTISLIENHIKRFGIRGARPHKAAGEKQRLVVFVVFGLLFEAAYGKGFRVECSAHGARSVK